jgi:hypothetical protein
MASNCYSTASTTSCRFCRSRFLSGMPVNVLAGKTSDCHDDLAHLLVGLQVAVGLDDLRKR